jgi:hypothetical protein
MSAAVAIRVTASEAPAPAPRSEWPATAVTLAAELAILLSVGLVLPLEYGVDQGTYAVVARELQRGAVLYRDVFDHKPPGTHLLFYLARLLAGDAHWGIRVIEAGFMLATVAGLVVLAQRHGASRRVGLVAGALSCLMLARQDFWHTAQPESFSGALIVWGLIFASLGHAARDGRSCFRGWVLSGVFFGLSGLLKPPPAMIGPVLADLSAWHLWKKARSSVALVPLAGVFVGLAIPFGLTLGWFAYRGALSAFWDAMFVFTPPFTKIFWSQHHSIAEWFQMLDRVEEWIFFRSTLATLGVILLVAYRPTPAERPLVVALSVSAVLLVLGVVAQAKFYFSHWDSFLPVLALLGALGLSKGAEAASRRGPWAMLGGLVLALVIATLHADVATANWDAVLARKVGVLFDVARGKTKPDAGLRVLESIDTDFPERNRLAGAYLAHRLPAGAPVFVWGFAPNLYDESGAPPASRYIYNLPLRADWYAAHARETLMKDLKARPPAAIVVAHGDVLPFLVGNDLDSAQALEGFAPLKQLIASDFQLDMQIGSFDVYVRRGLNPPGG